jgi:hypothetical protein
MQSPSDPHLLDLGQSWLDRMGAACFADDFETFAAGISLPFVLVTSGGQMVQTCITEIRQGFDTFHEMLRTLHATQMLRLAECVWQVSPQSLVVAYETQILSGGQRVVDPFRSVATLIRSDDGLRAASIVNGLSNRKWPIDVLRVDAPDPASQRHD